MKTVKSPPSLADIITIADDRPGFIARLDQAICALYAVRCLRRRFPDASKPLDELEEAVSEPLNEWFFATRSLPGGPFDR